VNDDPILDELAKAAREDRARSEDLVRDGGDVARADDEEEAFVRSVLAGGDDDALAAAAMNALQAKPQQDAPAPSPTLVRVEKTIVRTAAPREPKALRPQPERARVVAFLGAAVALAAGVLLYVKHAQREPDLPGYEAVLEGTDAPDRAAPQASTKVSRGAGLSLVARPKEPVTTRLEGAAFGGCGGALVRLPAPVQIAPTGAARVAGTPESLFGAGASGACRLTVVVAPAGRLPDRLEDARGETRVVEAAFVIEE